METFYLDRDVKLVCVTADSFPQGIGGAHQKLHGMLTSTAGRNFFGISRQTPNGIIYKAGVEQEHEREAEKFGGDVFTVRKGHYLSIMVHDFMQNVPRIGEAFTQMLAHPALDPEGCCVEMYLDDRDVRCMVTLDPTRVQAMEIVPQLRGCFDELRQLVSSLDEDELNRVPPEGGWSVAQVAEHLVKSYGVVEALQGNTEPAQRPVDERIPDIKKLFLDFNNKINAPEFIIPSEGVIERESLLKELQSKTETILGLAETADPSLLCPGFRLPKWGALTRLEWYNFILYHTQRHIHQVKKIISGTNHITNEKVVNRES